MDVLFVSPIGQWTRVTHNFINRARTNADMIRGYALLLEILQGFSQTPVLPFDAGAVAVFDDLRRQQVLL